MFNEVLASFRVVEAKVRDSEIVPREFELQLRYSVHFRTNSLGKRMNTFVFPRFVLNSFWHEITQEGWYTIKRTKKNLTNKQKLLKITIIDLQTLQKHDYY